MEEFMVTIKKGNVILTCPRKTLTGVQETHDGVVFNFSNGSFLYFVDTQMPIDTKHLISNSSKIPKGNLFFDLLNYRQPARIET